MKYLFYIVLLAFLYRVLFRPKIIVEHRHMHDKKKKDSEKLVDYTDYEEIK